MGTCARGRPGPARSEHPPACRGRRLQPAQPPWLQKSEIRHAEFRHAETPKSELASFARAGLADAPSMISYREWSSALARAFPVDCEICRLPLDCHCNSGVSRQYRRGISQALVHPCEIRRLPLDCHCNSGVNITHRRETLAHRCTASTQPGPAAPAPSHQA